MTLLLLALLAAVGAEPPAEEAEAPGPPHDEEAGSGALDDDEPDTPPRVHPVVGPEATQAADESEPPPPRARRTRFEWGGHVKSFAVVSLPYRVDLPDDVVHDLLNPLPVDPMGQGILDGRLNLMLQHGRWLTVEAAHAITTFLDADAARDARSARITERLEADPLATLALLARLGALTDPVVAPGRGAGGGPFQAGVGVRAPEAIPLTWWAFEDDGVRDVRVQGRTDRLLVRFKLPKVDVTLGRQPIGFGAGLFFTPLDLVAPFTPATIDTEYKPGVDALRVDAYPTFATRITAVAAYTGATYVYEDAALGEPESARVAAALLGQHTVGVTDLGLFYGFIRGDHVIGASVAGSAGPVGLYGDATVTVPRPDLDEPVFLRAVVGANGRPTGTTTLSGELYVQTFGTSRSDELFRRLASERVRRGEVWLAGIAYAALSVSQEITPLLVGNVALITNLTDPSALLLPSVSWSVAQDVEASFGAYVGLGRRPEGRPIDLDALPERPTADDLTVVRPRSEFGTYPATLFVQLRAYF